MPASPPDALLFITPGCPHCPGVLQGLSDMVKQGTIGKLTVINAFTHPELAAEQGVRTAPWLRQGPFTLSGAQTHHLHHQLQCGPDSYVKHFINSASPDPFLVLQFDEHTNDAGAMTRCEAYLDSKGFLRWWVREDRAKQPVGER